MNESRYIVWIVLASCFAVLLAAAIIFKILAIAGKRFPEPARHNLSWPEMLKYWRSMPANFQAECIFRIYRMDPALAPYVALMTADYPPTMDRIRFELYPPEEWWRSSAFPNMPANQQAHFCARLSRSWKNEAGLSQKAEICIANFTMGPNAE